jgi:hypothetical protein
MTNSWFYTRSTILELSVDPLTDKRFRFSLGLNSNFFDPCFLAQSNICLAPHSTIGSVAFWSLREILVVKLQGFFDTMLKPSQKVPFCYGPPRSAATKSGGYTSENDGY